MTPAATINAITGPVLILVVFTLTAAMGARLFRHYRMGSRAPLLLIRDFALWATLVVMIAGSQYARATGARLGNELWYVLLTNGLAISTAALWLAIEMALIGRDREE